MSSIHEFDQGQNKEKEAPNQLDQSSEKNEIIEPLVILAGNNENKRENLCHASNSPDETKEITELLESQIHKFSLSLWESSIQALAKEGRNIRLTVSKFSFQVYI